MDISDMLKILLEIKTLHLQHGPGDLVKSPIFHGNSSSLVVNPICKAYKK